MLADIRGGIWDSGEGDRSDIYQRNLQRAHVELLVSLVENRTQHTDLSALARWELRSILLHLRGRVDPSSDRVTAAHFDELAARIDKALDLQRGVHRGRQARL